MKTVYATLGFALSASAASLVARDQCCFGLTASGGKSGVVGQLSDGQNRIGQTSGLANQASQYCLNNGAVTDGNGRGCILTPPTTQFQCDTGASPSPGFSLSGSNLAHNGSTTFVACPTGDNGGYNIYTTAPSGQAGCVDVTLSTGGACSSSSSAAASSSTASVASASAASKSAASASAASASAASASAASASASSASAASRSASSASAASASAASASAASKSAASASAASVAVAATPVTQTVYQTKFVTVNGCTASSAPAVPAPASSAPASHAPASSVPASSAPASSAPASSVRVSSAPASSAPAQSTAASRASSASTCQTSLSGAYQTPHAIIPVNKQSPNTAYGTQYNAYISSANSTIFNFDIPSSYAGKQCTVIFLFPKQSQLETSSFTQSGSGGLTFSLLSSAANQQTSYANAPAVAKQLDSIASVAPGNSYVVSTGACAAGTTQSIEVSSINGYSLEFFEDWNPSPIGLFLTSC